MNRRKFLKITGLGTIGAIITPILFKKTAKPLPPQINSDQIPGHKVKGITPCDELGQRGFVSWKTSYDSVILNKSWVAKQKP